MLAQVTVMDVTDLRETSVMQIIESPMSIEVPPLRVSTSPMDAAIDAFGRGGMVVLDGSHSRRGVTDVVIAAEHADADAIAMLARDVRGLVCLALPESACDRLGLPPMEGRRGRAGGVAYAVSVDLFGGAATGISAAGRAATVAAAIAPDATRDDFVVPGHLFPIRAHDHGTLANSGHAEAGIDLARLSGGMPAAVTCSLLTDAGDVARGDEVAVFARRWGLPVITADDVQHRMRAAV